MVGLPARGKSYITRKISNYLRWLNIENRVFNVGNRRRHAVENSQGGAQFFDPNCKENVDIRNSLAMETLDEALHYMSMEGQAAIFDATNSTTTRRKMVVDHIERNKALIGDYEVVFLESICDDAALIEQNMRLKLNGPDYRDNENKLDALNDFKERLINYESIYETVTSSEVARLNCSYIKIINVFTIKHFNIHGFLPIILNNFLTNFNITKKKVWLSLNHVDFCDIASMADSPHLIVCNSTKTAHRRLPLELALDQVHDLILDIEAAQTDILIQTGDELLINGILKYFNLLDQCHADLGTQLVCIQPHLYSVGLQQFNILEIPSMTRSNSNISNTSALYTPKEDVDLTAFNYKNLNLSELQARLALLPQ